MVGVCAAEPSDHVDFYMQWIAAESHGEMHYLAENVEKRNDPTELLPGAKSVICVADLYHSRNGLHGDDSARESDEPRGLIARYAWGDDYHKVIKKRLFTFADALREQFLNEQFKVAVDTAPVLEREHAMRAGLGWVGKHTLLIHPEKGSYLLLGEIITTLEIETSQNAAFPGDLMPPEDHCGTCTQCIDACPTDCITPYQLDAKRCISYLTIEHRGVIDESLHQSMGQWIAGCDICQEVCPFNAKRERNETKHQEHVNDGYEPRETFAHGLSPGHILQWTEDDRRDAFHKSALKRIKLDMIKRNALIAAANIINENSRQSLVDLAISMAADEDSSPMLRATARQVLDQLVN